MIRARTLRTIMDTVPEARPWLWEGYVARGSITAVSGLPKVGKTTLLGDFIAAMLEGRPEFCGAALTPTPVVYVSEESAVEWRQRGREWPDPVLDGLHLATREDLMGVTEWPLLVDAVAMHAAEVGAGLVVFDTLRALARFGEGGENDAGKMSEAFEPIRAAAGSGLAVLINHHDRKGGGEHGEGAAGSGAFVAHLDALVTMSRFGDAKARRGMKVLSRWPAPDDVVIERRPEFGYVLLGSQSEARAIAGSERVEEIAARLAAAIAASGVAVTHDEARESVGEDVSAKVCRTAMSLLVESGRVRQVGKGVRGDPFRFSAPLGTEAERIESGDSPDPAVAP